MKCSNQERGIVYIATGEEYIKESIFSAHRVKELMTEISITLMSNKHSDSNIFDNEIIIENPRFDFGDQVFHIEKSPYQKTICLDSDTYLDDSIEDIFVLLNKFDIAVCQNPVNYSSNQIDIPEINSVPLSFPEYNTGVVAFKKSERILDFFSNFKQLYNIVLEHGQKLNQAAFRKALYESQLRIASLPSNYNYIVHRPGKVNGKVKVFHTRLLGKNKLGTDNFQDLKEVFKKINNKTGLRLTLRFNNKIRVVMPRIYERVLSSLKNDGLKNTILNSFKKLI